MRLELREVSRHFPGVAAVDRLSLAVGEGRIGCLLGPSGSGKTTVLRAIAGFERPDSGEVLAGGEILSGRGTWVPPERRRIGMVFQDFALFPHLSAVANVAFGLRDADRGSRRSRATELLALVGLAAEVDRFPHELSGGQQQRVALARALAPRPRLVLLDEPFSNLDADVRMELAQYVRTALVAEGATALLVTHDQREAFAIADEIGVLRAGRLEQWDAPWKLYHSPATRFVADFVGEGSFIPGTVLGPGRVSTELGVIEGQLTTRAAARHARRLAAAARRRDSRRFERAAGRSRRARFPRRAVPLQAEASIGRHRAIVRPQPSRPRDRRANRNPARRAAPRRISAR